MKVNRRSLELQYKGELEVELINIIKYWSTYTVDEVNGGFLGKVANDNTADAFADKGAVLNARILWSFSAAYNLDKSFGLKLADRAYDYIISHFIDSDFGGVYWTVDYAGKPKDTKKQIYAQAFTIYALSEYFMAVGIDVVKDHAIALFRDLVKYSFDVDQGGYFEAFNREWNEIDDFRLSDKDANEKKTMNTHLHILEAFTNLYRIWPDEALKDHIVALIKDFCSNIVDLKTGRLTLFFDQKWTRKSEIISFGHDIEASWLLQEAAEVVEDPVLLHRIKALAVKMAEAALSGLDSDGGLWYEQEGLKGHFIKQKHWWVQAEAMVGFYNAWQVSEEPKFFHASLNSWNFVKEKILDKQQGEWFWGITEAGAIMNNEDKAGLWKCPYHNSRACIELIRRIPA